MTCLSVRRRRLWSRSANPSARSPLYGAELGIDIRMEVHGNQTCLLPNIKKIIDIADHPNATVCWN